MEEIKQTEFNMNVATLMRIDTLIKEAHLASRGGYPRPIDNDIFYVETLDREYIESHYKFSRKEKNIALWYQNKIDLIMKKWGNNFYQDFVDYDAGISNIKYTIARHELKTIARRYEIFLMGAMGKHGMLLTDSKDAISKFRSG